MRYVLMIHAAESRYAKMSEETLGALMSAHDAFSRELDATGKAGDAAALEATDTATTVAVRDGKRIVKDGPFAETREQLGGYYALEGSEEEALAWAAKIPDAEGGTIEVRPLVGAPAPPASDTPPLAPGKEYLLLIYEAEARWATMSPGDAKPILDRYMAFTADLRAKGQLVNGERLAPSSKAKSLSVTSGKRVVRDGPFAETREQLGGYYRVRAKDLDEAIAMAARIPAVEVGRVEVRPVMDTSGHM